MRKNRCICTLPQKFFSFFFILLMTSVPSASLAHEITLAWDANSGSPAVDGYRIFSRKEGENYNYGNPVWEGSEITCPVEVTVDTDTYFVVRAFNASGESGDSNEAIYQPGVYDLDEDGLTDAEEVNVFGTDPSELDTDNDGLNDGVEALYWGPDWDVDYDSDGLNNLLDPDADNDGFLDGVEVNGGSDPDDPVSIPSFALIAHYKFDGDFTDSSGQSNDLTNYNEVGFEPGQLNQAASFDGIDDGLGRTELNNMPREQISMGGWIKAGAGERYTRIIEIGQNSTDSTAIVMDSDEAGTLEGFRYWVHVDGRRVGGIAATDYDYHDNQWHHVFMTYDGTKMKLFVDGELKRSSPVVGVIDSTAELNIGQHDAVDGRAAHTFNGLIEEVKIYSHALSDQTILGEYHKGDGGIVAHYRFDGDFTDSSGQSNDLTNYNEVGFEPGQLNQAASFDGIDDGLGRTELNNMPREQISMGGWIKAGVGEGYTRIIEIGQNSTDLTAIVMDSDEAGTLEGFRYWVHVDGRRVGGIAATDYDYHDNQWHHVFMTYDGTTMKLFVDGELKDSNPVVGVIDSTAELNIGQYNAVNGGAAHTFNGLIDEVKIYSRALSDQEILEEYINGGNY